MGIEAFIERHKSGISEHGLRCSLYYVCKK